jgi:hypothetical protein
MVYLDALIGEEMSSASFTDEKPSTTTFQCLENVTLCLSIMVVEIRSYEYAEWKNGFSYEFYFGMCHKRSDRYQEKEMIAITNEGPT